VSSEKNWKKPNAKPKKRGKCRPAGIKIGGLECFSVSHTADFAGLGLFKPGNYQLLDIGP
jgi:hypothetical protein